MLISGACLAVLCVCVRESESERERERERQTDRETDRDTYSQVHAHRHRRTCTATLICVCIGDACFTLPQHKKVFGPTGTGGANEEDDDDADDDDDDDGVDGDDTRQAGGRQRHSNAFTQRSFTTSPASQNHTGRGRGGEREEGGVGESSRGGRDTDAVLGFGF